MKVAILAYAVHRGAFASVARNISKGLTALGAEVDIIYLIDATPSAVSPDDLRGMNLIRLGGRAGTCAPAVARYLRAHRPDALISLSWLLNAPAVASVMLAGTRTPLILNEGSLLSYKARVEHCHDIRFRFMDDLAKLIYPKAAAVTGASSAIIRDLVVEIGIDPRRTRVRVVPNAVDADHVISLARRPGTTLVEHDPMFVHVGRHAPQKNLPLLIQAFHSYLTSGAPGTLVLIGDGPETGKVVGLADDLAIADRVKFQGHVANPFPHVAASTALVMSSAEEGFGLALVEAMVLGVPVISTDCPGGPREILLDGRAGILVPPQDVRALANAMRRVSEDRELRTKLAAAGRERAKDFSLATVGRQWLALVQECLT